MIYNDTIITLNDIKNFITVKFMVLKAALGGLALKNGIYFSILLISLPLLLAISLFGWRIDYLCISDESGGLIFAAPAANGNKFITRYIHSVERTPVEDDYRITAGRIWMWEERVRSSSAGLPSLEPAKGRFIDSGNWFVYQGGRYSVSEYYYRVGNHHYGLNQADFEPFGRSNLYKIYKGERLRVSVERINLSKARLYADEKLLQAPRRVKPVTRN